MIRLKMLIAVLALGLFSAQSQAALYEVFVTISGTISGADPGSQTGSAMGVYSNVTNIITFTGDTASTTTFTDFSYNATVELNAVTGIGTRIVNSCVDNGGIFNGCGEAGLIPDVPIAVPLPISMTGNIDPLGNGAYAESEFIPGTPLGTIVIDTNYRLQGGRELVPVPAAVWLFGSGLALLGWIRRR